jgi:hypothetical protein
MDYAEELRLEYQELQEQFRTKYIMELQNLDDRLELPNSLSELK